MLQLLGEHSEALSAVTFALKTHPFSVALWLLRLGMVGVAPSGSTHGEVGMEELGDLCKQALDQVPVKVCKMHCMLQPSVQMVRDGDTVCTF